ncbi:MAG: purine-nucleoside phosphorylase, partial [Planctomycetota bacterium]
MLHLHDQIEEAAAKIQSVTTEVPKVAIILGTGLGGLVGDIDVEATLPYEEIPHFLSSTATSHAGRLVIGKLGGVPVIAMEGRQHFYEGYPLDRITLPVRVFKKLGAELLVVSNACGGLNPYFNAGDIMVIEDQINLMGGNPLIGINDDRLGPRFPDMCEPYSQAWIDTTLAVAHRNDLYPHKGVFVAVAGPCLETRAEYRFLR